MTIFLYEQEQMHVYVYVPEVLASEHDAYL
jgi:hypothetical protein